LRDHRVVVASGENHIALLFAGIGTAVALEVVVVHGVATKRLLSAPVLRDTKDVRGRRKTLSIRGGRLLAKVVDMARGHRCIVLNVDTTSGGEEVAGGCLAREIHDTLGRGHCVVVVDRVDLVEVHGLVPNPSDVRVVHPVGGEDIVVGVVGAGPLEVHDLDVTMLHR